MKTSPPKFRPTWIAALVIVAVGVPVQAESPQDILIVANTSVDQKDIEKGEVRAIFLKNKTSWSSGQKIVAVNAKPGTELRDQFQKRVLEMDSNREVSFFEEQKVRYGTSPPVEFPNPLRAVFHLKGSIGYVFRKDYKEGVAKVLLVIPSDG
jgi:ABC-type phosphate transport system substrate-binding protein